MKKNLIQVLQYSCILLFLGLAWTAVGWTRADILIREVRKELVDWQSNGVDLATLEEWESTRNKLETVISLRPREPEYYRWRGFLYTWRFNAPITRDGSILSSAEYLAYYQDTVDQILSSYRTSISLRPIWPYYWVHLARAKGAFRQYDEEFSSALHNIVRFGKQEPRMQQELNALATQHYNYIKNDEALLDLVTENFAQSLSRDGGNVRKNIDLLRAGNLLATACSQINTELILASAQRACEQATAAD